MNQMEITVLENQSIFFRFLHTRLHKAAVDFTLFLASFTFYDYFQGSWMESILCHISLKEEEKYKERRVK